MTGQAFERLAALDDELAGQRPVAVEGSAARSPAPRSWLQLEGHLGAGLDVGLQGLGGLRSELAEQGLEAKGAHGVLTSCSARSLLPGAAPLASARARALATRRSAIRRRAAIPRGQRTRHRANLPRRRACRR